LAQPDYQSEFSCSSEREVEAHSERLLETGRTAKAVLTQMSAGWSALTVSIFAILLKSRFPLARGGKAFEIPIGAEAPEVVNPR
jgi:hypothetical protein